MNLVAENGSPDRASLIIRTHHGVTGLATERLTEFRHITKGTNDAVFADRMRIGEHKLALRIGANFVSARLSPGDKKLLFRREAILVGRARLALH
jgi:hypothetical protein